MQVVQSSHVLHTQFPLLITIYIFMVYILQLMKP